MKNSVADYPYLKQTTSNYVYQYQAFGLISNVCISCFIIRPTSQSSSKLDLGGNGEPGVDENDEKSSIISLSSDSEASNESTNNDLRDRAASPMSVSSESESDLPNYKIGDSVSSSVSLIKVSMLIYLCKFCH